MHKGDQPIDRQYEITSTGKIKLLKETFYQPQIYTQSIFESDACISQGNEKAISN